MRDPCWRSLRAAPPLPAAPRRLALLLPLLLLAACARDADDWRAATAADTTEAYAAFLQRHPESSHAAAARVRTSELMEKRDWDLATQSDTPESYRQFLARNPDGAWAPEARIRIANFELAEAPVAAAVPSAPAAPATAAAAPAAAAPAVAPRTAPPVARVAPPSTPRASGTRTSRVQLGAFSTRDKAVTEWQRLRSRFEQLSALEPLYVEAQSGGNPVVRLQSDVADEAAADALCDALRAARQGCIRVPKAR